MARVAEHLGLSELEERFRTAKDPILARHVQVIWLLAQGHTTAEVSAVTSVVPRWIEQWLARYNAEGLAALGDLRRHNGRAPALLKPDVLERLRVRLADPPPDGGLWTSGKGARWMASELGRDDALDATRLDVADGLGLEVEDRLKRAHHCIYLRMLR